RGLPPGAVRLPYREEPQEQLDWIAQDVESLGGDAWVLPVTGLSESEERLIRERMLADRDQEYRALEQDALAFLRRRSGQLVETVDHPTRVQVDKELLALQRRFRKVVARDYVGAPARVATAQAIDPRLSFPP